MPSSIELAPNTTWKQTIPPSNALDPATFAPFGEVIQNPRTHDGKPSLGTIQANQGTATKWLDVTHLENWYHLAPSGKTARPVMNMFVCRPRKLLQERFFEVKVLERHPFTPQTFVPMGMGPQDRYLVIVAPTLKGRTTGRDGRDKPYPAEYTRPKKSLKERLLGARPNPFTNDHEPCTTPSRSNLGPERKPKGSGEPDFDNIQAFIARGDQAVTYGPGTWHAPMVVLGKNEVEFVVVQYANGVPLEDCQEVDLPNGQIAVDVNLDGAQASAPGIMRAKL
ncbi:ureidoglycolate hydrolase [Lecanosticta acicola]|uniref:Ureidoglycolate hydrolase n=1 Tax=Lecanosticta acicola TaxID=111012 RepID=A0AAI9E9V9_9PEZI|nr:ureidoglycolate hydrolase [Lecanosticta acicola]